MNEPTPPSKAIPDPARYGMVGVSREAFFATVGQLDVHPSPVGPYDRVFGYTSEWKTRAGQVLAKTVGGTHLSETAYLVSQTFYERHREVFDAPRSRAPSERGG